MTSATILDDGLDLSPTGEDSAFLARNIHPRRASDQLGALQRIASTFIGAPDEILQEVVNCAVELCGADSAGISIVKEDATPKSYFHWIATAGAYSPFLHAELPQWPSACSQTIAACKPQLFRVRQEFFDILGVSGAPLVTDGLLLPWKVDDTDGTIFIMAHGRTEAFDKDDLAIMELLANFAAMAVHQAKQRKVALAQSNAAGAAHMANVLAHRINNPLQSMTNILYLAANGHNGEEARAVGQQALADLERLTVLVARLLDLRYD